ncbi:MAG: hypothetical protein H0V12_01335 [Chloroflexi bacterium]|nr:hypothetical protein [Chloroflexota bacterium]
MPGAGGAEIDGTAPQEPREVTDHFDIPVGPHGGRALSFGPFDFFESAFEWLVPGLLLSVPGLLLVLAVGGQAVGGFLWLPLVRRQIGAFGLRLRRDR